MILGNRLIESLKKAIGRTPREADVRRLANKRSYRAGTVAAKSMSMSASYRIAQSIHSSGAGVGAVLMATCVFTAACGAPPSTPSASNSVRASAQAFSSPSAGPSSASCVVTEQEASHLVGDPISSANDEPPGCLYYGNITGRPEPFPDQVVVMVIDWQASNLPIPSPGVLGDLAGGQVLNALKNFTIFKSLSDLNIQLVKISGSDGAGVAEGSGTNSGHTLNSSSIVVLKGSTALYIDVIDFDQPAASPAVLESQAARSVGRLHLNASAGNTP